VNYQLTDLLLQGELSDKHPIIGFVLLGMLLLQGPLGYIHHTAYKRSSQRTIWSHIHLWLGRIAIPLGIINGGFGFELAGDIGTKAMIAYCVVAAVIYVVYLTVAIFGEVRRKRGPSGKEARTQSSMTDSPVEGRGAAAANTRSWPEENEGGNGVMHETPVYR
jgi:hypothetical protein